MNNLTNDQDGEFRKHAHFPSSKKIGSVSGLGSPFPSGKGPMPASRLQTVFAITHPDQSMKHFGLSAITEMEMLTHFSSDYSLDI